MSTPSRRAMSRQDQPCARAFRVGVLGCEVVPASFTGGGGFLAGIVDDLVLAVAPQAKLPPLIAFDPNRGTPACRRA